MGVFRRGLEIDKNDLDTCIMHQPGLFQDVADAYVEAMSIRDYAKAEEDRVESEVSRRIRAEAERDDKGKGPTEATVKALVTLDAEVIAAKRHTISATNRAAALALMRESYSQRAYALKDLAQLWLGGYFQTSSINSVAAGHAQDEAYMERRRLLNEKRQAMGGTATRTRMT